MGAVDTLDMYELMGWLPTGSAKSLRKAVDENKTMNIAYANEIVQETVRN